MEYKKRCIYYSDEITKNTILSNQKCFHNTNIILDVHFTELLHINVFLGLKLLHLIHTLCLNH